MVYAQWGELPIVDWSFKSHAGHDSALLPESVLFGNSFSDLYTSAGLHTRFTVLHRTGSAPERLGPLLMNLPPGTRWFIWQFFEPNLREILSWDVPARATR